MIGYYHFLLLALVMAAVCGEMYVENEHSFNSKLTLLIQLLDCLPYYGIRVTKFFSAEPFAHTKGTKGASL